MLITDLADPTTLQGFVRNIPLDEFSLNRWLPDVDINDIEYLFYTGQYAQMDAAMFRTWDTEVSIGSRPGFSRRQGELPPIGKKMRLGEEQTIRLRGLQGVGGTRQRLIDQVFNDAANLARAVVSRIEIARGDAIFNQSVTIDENGFDAMTVDYDEDGKARSAVATDGGGLMWDDPDAEIVDFLTGLVQDYLDDTGQLPGCILGSRKVRNAIQRNTQLARSQGIVAGSPTIMTVEQVRAAFDNFDLPPFVTYDTRVPVNGTMVRTTPIEKIALLPAPGAPRLQEGASGAASPLGRTHWGVTAEATELAEANAIAPELAPGLTAVVMKTEEPVSTWTKVAAISLPTVAAPELITVAEVLTS